MKKKFTLQAVAAFLLLFFFSIRTQAQSCEAGFSFTSPNQNGLVVFQDSSWSQDPILSYTWSLGDGTTATTPTYTHVYTANGTYQVCLIIQSASCTDTVCQYIAVTLSNPCNLSGVIYLIGPPPQTTLSADIVGGIPPYSYNWNTGETTQSISAISSMNYCVTVTDLFGCTFNTCFNFNSNCNLLTSISADTTQNVLSAIATLGAAPYSYVWSTGSTSAQINLTTAGNYCVTVTDGQGCTSTSCYNYSPQGCGNVFSYTSIAPGVYQFVLTSAPTIQTIWDFGDGSQPDTIIGNQITHTYLSTMSYMVCMTVVGCATFCTPVYAQANPTSIICGNVFNDANTNSINDSSETGMGGLYLFIYGQGVQQSAYSDSVTGNYSFNVPAGTYTVQMCPSGSGILQNSIITVPTSAPVSPPTSCASYTVTIGTNDTLCGFNYGIFTNASTVSGTLFYDVNNNGMMDGNDSGLPYQIIYIGTHIVYTNAVGYYSISLPIGNYSISYTPTGFYSSGNITTSNVVANVVQNGIVYGNNNVGLYLTPGQVDLGVTIHPSTTVTPGFGAWYSINVCNNGPTPTGATVIMQYDAVLTPNYQSPAASNMNTTNHLLTWNIPTLNPGACAYFWLTFNAAVGIPLGSSIIEFVSVSPTIGIDNNLNNNTDTIHQIVVGSWDPNSKVVDYTNTMDPNFQLVAATNPNQEIRYTVNFQNTGNAPAHNVVVIDEMSSNLDINTYQFIGSSHNCEIQRNGNTTTYKFMNIMLPDSVNDEPASHGYISYKLNALSSLTIGDQLIDYANIYFDFNDPVLTEDAIVTVVGPTRTSSILSMEQLTISPNPAQDFVFVNVQSAFDGILNLCLLDATGKVCLQQQRNVKVGYNKLLLNTSELSKGIYFVQTTTQGGIVKTSKLSIK